MRLSSQERISLVGCKAILAIICGVVLAFITSPIHRVLGSPTGDYVLLAIYFLDYFIVVQAIPRRLREGRWLRKGVTVFYSVEFIAWVVTCEILTYG